MGQQIGTKPTIEIVFTIVFVTSDMAQRMVRKFSECRHGLHRRRKGGAKVKIGAVVPSGTTVSGVIVMTSNRRLKDFLSQQLRKSAWIEQVYIVDEEADDRPSVPLFPERGDFREFMAA